MTGYHFMNKTVVIHHSADFDGIFCREIAHKFLPDAELVGWDYGNPAPEVSPDSKLYMLDISIEGLMAHPNLIWIDHHKSAMEKFPASIPGYRIDGVAACRLAWQWFMHCALPDHDGHELPSKPDYVERNVIEPMSVRLAGEYDIWDKRDPNAELFQHGLRSRELGPDTWDILLSGPTAPENGKQGLGELYVDTLLDAGEALQYARTKENASIIKEIGFTLKWEGLTFLACNAARYNSFLFTAGLKPEHDACFGFKWTGKDWSVSLYHAPGKEHHDLSLIASRHGGGGHRGACGFRLSKDALLGVICNDNSDYPTRKP
jgi:hypothetical protein